MSRSGPPSAPLRPWAVLEAIKDNVEAFTIALVMALVIKHFCVEAFKIPTSSMMPTLRGDTDAPNGEGDRILVDKWAYLLHGPRRYDVIVFHYPLNESKHFIKRVAGVGPEWLRIHEGDVWTRATEEDAWRIARKGDRARDELWVPVWPTRSTDPVPSTDGIDGDWEIESGWRGLPGNRFRHEGEARSTVALRARIGADSDARLTYDPTPGRLVRDVRVRLVVTAEAGGAMEVSWRTHAGATTTLHLASADGGDASWVEHRREDREERRPLDVRLAPGARTPVVFEVVDGDARVHVSGDEVLVMDLKAEPVEEAVFQDASQRLEIAAEGAPVDVDVVGIDRDIWYRDGGDARFRGDGIYIPADTYFMLGDNTASSSDSRRWSLRCVHLLDGTEICYDGTTSGGGTYPHYDDDGKKRVVDQHGVEQVWREEDEDPSRPYDMRQAPFVDRSLVVGRAFFIFWPLVPDPPGRLGFIH